MYSVLQISPVPRSPNARVAGFTVQPMVRRPAAQELIVGVATDPIFGPVIGGIGGMVWAYERGRRKAPEPPPPAAPKTAAPFAPRPGGLG